MNLNSNNHRFLSPPVVECLAAKVYFELFRVYTPLSGLSAHSPALASFLALPPSPPFYVGLGEGITEVTGIIQILFEQLLISLKLVFLSHPIEIQMISAAGNTTLLQMTKLFSCRVALLELRVCKQINCRSRLRSCSPLAMSREKAAN